MRAPRKPGSPRGEVDWGDYPSGQQIGTVHDIGHADDAESPKPTAILWVPDPEQRHGWREFYVYPKQDKPGQRKLGW